MSAKNTLTERYDDLRAAYDEAAIAASEAFHRQLRKRTEAPAEVMAPFTDFHDAIRFKRPDATPLDEREDRQRELTDELFEAVKERGLLFKVVHSEEGLALGLTDPNVDADHEAAVAAQNAAQDAVLDFERDHGDELKAEQRKADADAIRDALAGDDPDAMRAAINGVGDALTSADVTPTRERVTTAG